MRAEVEVEGELGRDKTSFSLFFFRNGTLWPCIMRNNKHLKYADIHESGYALQARATFLWAGKILSPRNYS